MAKNPKKCSDEMLISIINDYVQNVMFKKLKYTELAEYARKKGFDSVDRRDFSRNEKLQSIIREINEKNALSEKALKLENKPLKSFYIDIDFIERVSKNTRMQYLNYFNKAQTDIIAENDKLKEQISQLHNFINTLKVDKVNLTVNLKEKKSEIRELKKLLVRESSKKNILSELELFEKLRDAMKVKGFDQETYNDFYNKYWNDTETDILDFNSMLDIEGSKPIESKVHEYKVLDDDIDLPDYDDF
jgi:SOS response regulatory protein OraA/RecX